MECLAWVQHADFETEDLPSNEADKVSVFLLEHDWRSENERLKDMEQRGVECCPPGLGINSVEDDRTLHICPDADGMCQVSYSFFHMEKFLGLFSRRKYQAGTINNVPLKVAALFVKPFIQNDYEAIRHEIEMRL